MNGSVEALLIQADGDLPTDAADAKKETATLPAPTVRNTLTGHVTGSVVQAGDVHGGLTIT